jgi:A/G-specific adenine glycosylase
MKRIAGQAGAAPAPAAPDFSDPGFSAEVIRWQKRHGRHALPWQNTRDPYRIWLSEIMLQQTQVSAVIPYYLRFLERFPDVGTLAAAAPEEVMSHWSGLGYYSRARNLHRCAQQVVNECGGLFPADPARLAELPGIGRSTAAAIAAFAYGRRAAILDGNVKRVFCRVFGVEGFPGAKPVEEKLWQRAVALLPNEGIEAYTQGLMDLGATVCTRGKPSCAACPLAQRCVALQTARTHLLPAQKPKKALPERHAAMLVVSDGGQVLLERRPDSGIWGGLLSLPELPDTADAPSAKRFEAALAGALSYGEVASCEPLAPFTHGFTHFKLHVRPYHVRLAKRLHAVGETDGVWYEVGRMAQAPLPAPVKKLLLALFGTVDLLSGIG